MAGSVSKVYLWVYWNGVWRKAYEGEQLIGSFDVAHTDNLTGTQNITRSVHGDFTKGTLSCNIGTQIKRMCTSNPPKAAYSLVGSAGVKLFGKWFYLSPRYYSALELGMKKSYPEPMRLPINSYADT